MELIRLEDIHKTYYQGEVEVPALRGVSLCIHRGEMVALMGASGSGKTTLMNILGCLDHPTSGRYWLDGEEMTRLRPNQRALVRAQKIGFVFQNFNLLARTTAVQNVAMPLDYSPRRCSPSEARRLAQTLLGRVGLAHRAHHEPSQMSGGQQQRVAIARALVNRPALILADEPTGNLDSHTGIEILRMFQQLNAEGITVVLVTHDPHVAAYAHRTIRIADGMIEGDDVNPSHPHGLGVEPESDARRAISAPRADLSHRGGNGDGCDNDTTTATTLEPSAAGATDAEAHAPMHASPKPESSPQNRLSQFYGDTLEGPRRSMAPALLPATWRTAFGALRRHKMRSGLSALGVIIAVAAVIAMREIGEGSKATLQKGMAGMGANTVMIFSDRHGFWGG